MQHCISLRYTANDLTSIYCETITSIVYILNADFYCLLYTFLCSQILYVRHILHINQKKKCYFLKVRGNLHQQLFLWTSSPLGSERGSSTFDEGTTALSHINPDVSWTCSSPSYHHMTIVLLT